MAASLQPNGAAVSGQQPQGIVQQYQLAATASNVDTSTGITPYDSGTILGTIPPGKAGIKLVSGVVQRAAQIVADSTAGAVGNALVSIYNTVGSGAAAGFDGLPTQPTGSAVADGLSQNQNTE
jgi:hypothetical protein